MSSSPSMSGSEFEVVLFDVGGVLLTNGWDHIQRAAVSQHFQIDHAIFESRHPKPYDALERDHITMSEYLEATVFYEPRSFSEEEYIELMKAQSVPLPDNALAVLGEVSTSCNWLVGLLNNESRLLHEYRMDKYGIEDYLDIQLSSCYVGLRKPDADIYRRAIDILGRPADRILFIDDRANNTEAARAAGLQAIQFQGEEKLRQDLKAIGIL